MVGGGRNAAALVAVVRNYYVKVLKMPILLGAVYCDSVPATGIYVYIIHSKVLVAVERDAAHIVGVMHQPAVSAYFKERLSLSNPYADLVVGKPFVFRVIFAELCIVYADK